MSTLDEENLREDISSDFETPSSERESISHGDQHDDSPPENYPSIDDLERLKIILMNNDRENFYTQLWNYVCLVVGDKVSSKKPKDLLSLFKDVL